MEFAGFDWDDGNRGKCQKHGVPIEVIESMFLRGLVILPDVPHSRSERRLLAMGITAEGRGVFVAFTLCRRGSHVLVRPISVRYMHEKEMRRYAQIYEIEEAPDTPE